jgi:hypothetical protein
VPGVWALYALAREGAAIKHAHVAD